MPTASASQFNIRSDFARERASELARQTGMTATKVVEEALRAYTPMPADVPEGFTRKGLILVRNESGQTVSRDELNAVLDAVREERGNACG